MQQASPGTAEFASPRPKLEVREEFRRLSRNFYEDRKPSFNSDNNHRHLQQIRHFPSYTHPSNSFYHHQQQMNDNAVYGKGSYSAKQRSWNSSGHGLLQQSALVRFQIAKLIHWLRYIYHRLFGRIKGILFL